MTHEVNKQTVNMGKTSSKSQVTHNADPQVRIINNQEYHNEQLENHEFLLYLILATVVIQLIITLYNMLKRRERKRALRIAKSLDNIADV